MLSCASCLELSFFCRRFRLAFSSTKCDIFFFPRTSTWSISSLVCSLVLPLPRGGGRPSGTLWPDHKQQKPCRHLRPQPQTQGKTRGATTTPGSRRGKVSNRDAVARNLDLTRRRRPKQKQKTKKLETQNSCPLIPAPSSVLFQNPNSRGQAGRDREAEAARKGEQVPQKDHENHPGVVARQRRRRHFVVAVVEGQVQACAPGVRGRRRDRRIWWWRRELPCLCFCRWPSGGREEGMREKGRGGAPPGRAATSFVRLLVLSLPREAALPSPVIERGEGDSALSLSLSLFSRTMKPSSRRRRDFSNSTLSLVWKRSESTTAGGTELGGWWLRVEQRFRVGAEPSLFRFDSLGISKRISALFCLY